LDVIHFHSIFVFKLYFFKLLRIWYMMGCDNGKCTCVMMNWQNTCLLDILKWYNVFLIKSFFFGNLPKNLQLLQQNHIITDNSIYILYSHGQNTHYIFFTLMFFPCSIFFFFIFVLFFYLVSFLYYHGWNEYKLPFMKSPLINLFEYVVPNFDLIWLCYIIMDANSHTID
jgi:hypothetical protein